MHKDRIQAVVETLPEDVDIDDFMDRLYLLQKIEIGERQIANGEGIPHEEAKRRLAMTRMA